MTSKRLAFAAPASLVFLLGCSSPTTVPQGDPLAADPLALSRAPIATETAASPSGDLLASEKGWGSYFPLVDGRTWSYHGTFSGWFTPYGGVPEPIMGSPYHYDLLWEIEGTRVLLGDEYAQIRETFQDENGEYQACLYYRQTRDGLFERSDPCGGPSRAASSSVSSRAAATPAGLRELPGISRERLVAAVQDARSRLARSRIAGTHVFSSSIASPLDEAEPTLLRLAYPLHPNREWLVVQYDADLEFRSQVVGREDGGGESAWKIQMLSSVLGPQDEAYLYFSRSGYLGYEAHLFGVATDEMGTPIGDFEFFERLDLSAGGF